VIAHDEQPEVIAHDEQPEVIAHDEQPEVIAHDKQPEVIAHDKQPEVIAHDEQPEVIAHDEQPEVIAHDEQPEVIAHDEQPEVIAHNEYSKIAEAIAHSDSTETESAPTSNEQIGKQIEHAEPAIQAETASLKEQPAEPTKMPPGVSDDPEDTGEIPGAAFKDYMVTMKSAKSETSDATDATPGAADTAGLKPEPPSAKPAFGAAAMLMKKAAEKKSEILKEKPGQTKETPEPAREDRDEPYSFTKPEFDVPEPAAGTKKSEAESKPKFDLENETGRIDMSQLKSLPEFGSKPASPAGISASDLAAKFGRRDDETGRINMRELMQQMPPHMAAALDKSAKSFEPGEEPQIQPAPSISNPTSPPNQFNRDAILPNIKADPSSSKTNLPSKEAEASPAPDATDKTKKKKTKESGKPKPAGEVVKNIQKMAPLSSIRAAEHHDLATQEVKAEHRELLNQTNQIKNKMLTVPDNSQESELERVWKQRFRATIQFAGKHQRHLVAVASVALFIVFGTVIASNMAQEDLLKQISDKWQHKQYDDATNLVDRGLAQFPNNANLHFFKARLLNKAGQEDQALSEVSTAVHLDPNNVAMIEQRAKLYLEMRKFDQAIEDYNHLVSPPNDKTAKAYLFADLATAHIEKKEFPIARSFADRAVQLEPNKPDYYATRAYAENGMNDFNGAINDWTSVISKDKKDANAYAERARAEFANHQTAKALADLAKSIAIKPNGTAHYYRALIYLDQKKQPLAIQELTEAVKYDSANSTYRDALAQIYANSGNFEQAMRNYDAVGALQRNSDSPDVLQNRIMTEMHEERFSEAARDLDRYIALKPDASWAVFCHAGCCVHTKEYSKAYDDYTNLIAKEPKNAVYYAGRGEVNAKEQHFDLASSDFEKAIALDPKKAQIYVYRGRSSADQGLYDQALIDLKHALALQPDNAVAKKVIKQVMEAKAKARPIITSAGGVSAPVTRMTGDPVKDGYNLMTAGNLPDAIQVLAKAVVKSPNNAIARRYLAYCLLDNGNAREAISQFKALDVMGVLNSTDDAKYIEALKSNGNFAEASVLVARKLAIHPDSIDTRIELANLYAQLSWKPKARQVLMEGMSHSTSPGDTATLQGALNCINNAIEQTAPGQTPNGVPPPHKISG
jgi:tetratricopeptide (TPR) repeat protein